LVNRSTPDKVLPAIGGYGGTILSTTLPEETLVRLSAALTRGNVAEVPGQTVGPGADNP
jgi:uncharacterized membrane protein